MDKKRGLHQPKHQISRTSFKKENKKLRKLFLPQGSSEDKIDCTQMNLSQVHFSSFTTEYQISDFNLDVHVVSCLVCLVLIYNR